MLCINDKFDPLIYELYQQLPMLGHMYIVRDVVPGTDYGVAETISVLLNEVRNRPNKKGVENGFSHTRFRELTEAEENAYLAHRQGIATQN